MMYESGKRDSNRSDSAHGGVSRNHLADGRKKLIGNRSTATGSSVYLLRLTLEVQQFAVLIYRSSPYVVTAEIDANQNRLGGNGRRGPRIVGLRLFHGQFSLAEIEDQCYVEYGGLPCCPGFAKILYFSCMKTRRL
jgi:hypothetical protein